MTSPTPTPPHQDPTPNPDFTKVSMLEYTSTLIAMLDRRFDTLHEDLKESVRERFRAVERAADKAEAESDLRYQQRYDSQQTAVKDALVSQDKAVRAALASAELAVSKSEVASTKRFDSVNEFRAQLADQASTFLPRAEAEARLAGLIEKVDDLRRSRDAYEGRTSAVPNADTQIQRLADEVRALRDYREASQGQVQGKISTIAIIVTAIGVVSTVITIVLVLVTALG